MLCQTRKGTNIATPPHMPRHNGIGETRPRKVLLDDNWLGKCWEPCREVLGSHSWLNNM